MCLCVRSVDSVSEWTLVGGQSANICADVCLDTTVTQSEALSSSQQLLREFGILGYMINTVKTVNVPLRSCFLQWV